MKRDRGERDKNVVGKHGGGGCATVDDAIVAVANTNNARRRTVARETDDDDDVCKADLEETERDLLSQCERTRDGEEDSDRAVVAGERGDPIGRRRRRRENVDDDDDDDDDAQERDDGWREMDGWC